MRLLELFAELRRRRVVRTAAAYFVASWLVIQVAATLFPILDFPEWAIRLVLALLGIGLPITVALAWSFDLTPDGFERTAAATRATGAAPALRWNRLLTAALLIVAVLAAGAWSATATFISVRAGELDDSLITVAPFRVAGADPGVSYLREGMVDLVAVKLTGSRRAVEPGTTLSAWRSMGGEGEAPSLPQAKKLATSLGARTVLLGSLAGSTSALTLSATLYDVATGRELATGSVAGSTDALPDLVDNLVAIVLSLEAGENAERLSSLTSTSLAAVRAYLDGNAHYRRGRYIEAVESYGRALEIDSTFALAALAMYDPGGMETFATPVQSRARLLVRANLDRLPPRERAYAEARFPAQPRPHIASWLSSLDSLTRDFPDRWEAWYAYADGLFHWGNLVAPHGNGDRARNAFERALRLDSTHAVVVQHLMMVSAVDPDTAAYFRYLELYRQQNPTGAFTFETLLRTAAWRGDTAGVDRLYASLDTVGSETLNMMAATHQLGPRPITGLRFARRAAELLFSRAGSTTERNRAVWQRVRVDLNGGRPTAAFALMDSVRRADRSWSPHEMIYAAVFLDGDTAAATEAAGVIAARVDELPAGRIPDNRTSDVCALMLLRLSRGQTDGTADAVERLRQPDPAGTTDGMEPEREVCVAVLDALRTHLLGTPQAAIRLVTLDSLMRTAPYASPAARDRANLVAARLFEQRNDPARAYEAARRLFINPGGETYVRLFYEMACRLGGPAGRADEGAWSCLRFLALLSDAEPQFGARAEAARTILARRVPEDSR